jgi:outer membrane lipoprotein SlyB
MKIYKIVYLALLLVGISACNSEDTKSTSNGSASTSNSESEPSNQGRVTNIQVITAENKTSGGGALLGAVLGGVVGHQVGSGTGKDVATGVGIVGGALAGNELEKNNNAEDDIYRVTVLLDGGQSQSFDYQDINNLQVGDRVEIENKQIVML